MATPRDIRRLALVALYQFDAQDGGDPQQIREGMDETVNLSLDEAFADDEGSLFSTPKQLFNDRDRERAFALAVAAWDGRSRADTEFETLAPEWPARRQAAIDRAILRLAHHEMVSGATPPKAAVNEAVELAKAFSTDRSPAFINGLLGKVLKRVLGSAEPLPTVGEGEHSEATALHLAGPGGGSDPTDTGPTDAGLTEAGPSDAEPGVGG